MKTPSCQRCDLVAVRSRPRLGRLATVCLVLAGWPYDATAQFLPPGVLNPAAAADRSDTQEFDVDQVIAPDGTLHAVFTSAYDYSGVADSDLDVWYVRNGGSGWTAPILVNRHYGGGDTAWDRHPKLALAENGTLYCAWETEHPGDGLGPDADVLFAELLPALASGRARRSRSPTTSSMISSPGSSPDHTAGRW